MRVTRVLIGGLHLISSEIDINCDSCYVQLAMMSVGFFKYSLGTYYSFFFLTRRKVNNFFFLFSDPYVKVYLLYKGQRVAKKKTHVKKRTLNPVYNESFVFEVPADNLDNVSLELLLLDWDRVTKNEVGGGSNNTECLKSLALAP